MPNRSPAPPPTVKISLSLLNCGLKSIRSSREQPRAADLTSRTVLANILPIAPASVRQAPALPARSARAARSFPCIGRHALPKRLPSTPRKRRGRSVLLPAKRMYPNAVEAMANSIKDIAESSTAKHFVTHFPCKPSRRHIRKGSFAFIYIIPPPVIMCYL